MRPAVKRKVGGFGSEADADPLLEATLRIVLCPCEGTRVCLYVIRGEERGKRLRRYRRAYNEGTPAAAG